MKTYKIYRLKKDFNHPAKNENTNPKAGDLYYLNDIIIDGIQRFQKGDRTKVILKVCPHMVSFGGGIRYYHPSGSGTIDADMAHKIWKDIIIVG